MTFFTGFPAHPSSEFEQWKKSEINTTTGNMVLDSNFKEFIQFLNARQVKYLVVGGFFENIPIHFIDLDNLIKNKRQSGRMKDLVDAEKLEKQKVKKKNA